MKFLDTSPCSHLCREARKDGVMEHLKLDVWKTARYINVRANENKKPRVREDKVLRDPQ